MFSIFGCGTTTQRLATEQLLVSDAVDQVVGEIDFSYLADRDVFLDTKFLNGVQGPGFANTDYIISSIRDHLAAAGCRVQDEREDARIIVEPRVGALGTNGHEVTYGLPQSNLASAATALSSAPIPAIPEISVGRSDRQQGIAKIVLFAYDRDTKVAIWQSGVKRSESSSSSTWVLGAGPFQKGTIHEGTRFAGQSLGDEHFETVEFGEETVLADINDPSGNSSTVDESVDEEAPNEQPKLADQSSPPGEQVADQSTALEEDTKVR